MGKKNPISHVEWRTQHAERLKSFYGGVFKWKFDDVAPGHYTMIDFGNKDTEGGIHHVTPEMQIPVGMCTYIAVASLDETEAKIKEHGGKVVVSKQEVPDWGHFSMFLDPDNNMAAAWTALSKKDRKKEKKAKKAEKTEKPQKAEKAEKAEKPEKEEKKKKKK